MKLARLLKIVAVGLSLFNVILPAQYSFGAETDAKHRLASSSPKIADIALGDQGRLSGVVLNVEGKPKAECKLVMLQNGREVAHSVSDELGRFQVDHLRGGLCEIAAGDAVYVCRCWTAQAAPPGAQDQLLVITPDGLARGQQPIGELLTNPLIIGLIIAAAIAIPIAVHNSRDRGSGS